jgi:hypothetical protein
MRTATCNRRSHRSPASVLRIEDAQIADQPQSAASVPLKRTILQAVRSSIDEKSRNHDRRIGASRGRS